MRPTSRPIRSRWGRAGVGSGRAGIIRRTIAPIVALLVALVGPGAPADASARELTVTTTIQAAVDAAQPGDTIRVPPGTYRENVVVNKDGLQIRGSHAAVLDGTGLPGTTGIRVAPVAPATVIRGFTLSGLTVQNYSRTGVLLRSVDGFRLEGGRYRHNGVYGIFPILSTHGVIEQNDVSGSDDSGIYIGQSSDVAIRANRTDDNTVGIEVENSSKIDVENNHARNNAIGIIVMVLPGLAVPATSDIQVKGNHLIENNRPNPVTDPTELLSQAPRGVGLLNVGGDRLIAERNIVMRNQSAGIGIIRLPAALASLDPRVDPLPDENRIERNVVRGNGDAPDPKIAPLPGRDLVWDATGRGNCWLRNVFETSFPTTLPACH